ncbi:hypothetical protein WG66_013464, partial [Moniliophthora roreri]
MITLRSELGSWRRGNFPRNHTTRNGLVVVIGLPRQEGLKRNSRLLPADELRIGSDLGAQCYWPGSDRLTSCWRQNMVLARRLYAHEPTDISVYWMAI